MGLLLKGTVVDTFANFRSLTTQLIKKLEPTESRWHFLVPTQILWQRLEGSHSHNSLPCSSHCAHFLKQRDFNNRRKWMREDGRVPYRWGGPRAQRCEGGMQVTLPKPGGKSFLTEGRVGAEGEWEIRWGNRLGSDWRGAPVPGADSLEKTLMLGNIKGKRRGQQRMRWLMISPTQWTWIWANSER